MIPRTHLGKYACGFTLAFLLLIGLSMILVALGQRGGDTFLGNLYLAIPGLLAVLCSTLALLSGMVSIVRSKERSPLVFLSTLIGLLATIFWVMEIIVGE